MELELSSLPAQVCTASRKSFTMASVLKQTALTYRFTRHRKTSGHVA
jgi:hypothetical protein